MRQTGGDSNQVYSVICKQPTTLPLSVPSFILGWNCFAWCIRHQIILFQYLLSLAPLIQYFWVPYWGSICTSCNFLNKRKSLLTRVYLFWFCGKPSCYGPEWLQLTVNISFQADQTMGLKFVSSKKYLPSCDHVFNTWNIVKSISDIRLTDMMIFHLEHRDHQYSSWMEL